METGTDTMSESSAQSALGKTRVGVNVHALWDDELEKVVFALGGTVEPKENGSVNDHVIKVLPGTGEADIEFKLRDHTGLKLRFRDEDDDPIWLRDKPECPTVSGLAGFGPVRGGDRKLSVNNPNVEGEYGYTLRFLDRNCDEHVCDPIIKNSL